MKGNEGLSNETEPGGDGDSAVGKASGIIAPSHKEQAVVDNVAGSAGGGASGKIGTKPKTPVDAERDAAGGRSSGSVGLRAEKALMRENPEPGGIVHVAESQRVCDIALLKRGKHSSANKSGGRGIDLGVKDKGNVKHRVVAVERSGIPRNRTKNFNRPTSNDAAIALVRSRTDSGIVQVVNGGDNRGTGPRINGVEGAELKNSGADQIGNGNLVWAVVKRGAAISISNSVEVLQLNTETTTGTEIGERAKTGPGASAAEAGTATATIDGAAAAA